jgi:hypothetical protein
MRLRKESRLCVVVCGLLCLLAGGAAAQNNPELGDVGSQPPPPPPQPQPAQSTWAPDAPPPPATATDENRFSGTDHGSVVGHFGAGFFGLVAVPISGVNGMGGPVFDEDQVVLAPTIGVRWWMQDWLGIEAALGIGLESGGTSFEDDMTSTETNEPSEFALALHGGLPMVVAASKHFAFEVIPELNFGFATGGVDDDEDVDLSGYVFEIGARAGAEIQFGFIDIPQLALQASLGLHLRIEGRGHTLGDEETSNSHVRFGTSVIGEPWDIFTGNLTAIYYF